MERGLIHIYCGDGKKEDVLSRQAAWSECEVRKRKCFLHVFLKMRIREN